VRQGFFWADFLDGLEKRGSTGPAQRFAVAGQGRLPRVWPVCAPFYASLLSFDKANAGHFFNMSADASEHPPRTLSFAIRLKNILANTCVLQRENGESR
jgi:hypothetical protein